MSFGGSATAMIVSLRNNARAKHKGFAKIKDNSPLSIHGRTKIRSEKVSKENLEHIKYIIRYKANKQRKRNRIILFITVTLSTAIIIFLTYTYLI